jgi:hypothetical protein
MNLIFDMKMMENQMAELEFDVKKQPLVKINAFLCIDWRKKNRC